jgi:Ca-activated chloride channel family protein
MSAWVLHDPLWLGLLALLPLAAWLRRRRGTVIYVVPEAEQWRGSARSDASPWPVLLMYPALALLIIGMARPQRVEPQPDARNQGYDLIIAIDLSTSMYAEDFQRGGQTVNRLQAIKPIIAAFINQRPDDRIGIVTFGGRAYTFAPLTFDHEWLRRQTARLSIGLIEDGTAIGDAIGVSLQRLRQGRKDDGESGPREGAREGGFIVLLTDGASNKGALDPRQAASLAAEEGVAVYTIGAGAEGEVSTPVFDYAGKRIGTEMRRSEIDTLLLRDIAESTGGLFFRATDEQAVEQAFSAINRDAKVEFDTPPPLISHERFPALVLPGVLLLGLALFGAIRRARQGCEA